MTEARLGECAVCDNTVMLTKLELCEECFRLEYIVQKDLPGVLRILERLDMTVLEWIPVEASLPDEREIVLTRGGDFWYEDLMVDGRWQEMYMGTLPTHWAKVRLP